MTEKIDQKNIYIGKVVRGDQRGRQIGFPTANLDLENNWNNLKEGIYSSICKYQNKLYKSTTHIGPASTFGKNKITFEVFIHDFDKEIYDQKLEVLLVQHLRGTVKFDSVESLIEQMKKDVIQSEESLSLSDYEF